MGRFAESLQPHKKAGIRSPAVNTGAILADLLAQWAEHEARHVSGWTISLGDGRGWVAWSARGPADGRLDGDPPKLVSTLRMAALPGPEGRAVVDLGSETASFNLACALLDRLGLLDRADLDA